MIFDSDQQETVLGINQKGFGMFANNKSAEERQLVGQEEFQPKRNKLFQVVAGYRNSMMSHNSALHRPGQRWPLRKSPGRSNAPRALRTKWGD
jgi:hypothetical protein